MGHSSSPNVTRNDTRSGGEELDDISGSALAADSGIVSNATEISRVLVVYNFGLLIQIGSQFEGRLSGYGRRSEPAVNDLLFLYVVGAWK